MTTEENVTSRPYLTDDELDLLEETAEEEEEEEEERSDNDGRSGVVQVTVNINVRRTDLEDLVRVITDVTGTPVTVTLSH